MCRKSGKGAAEWYGKDLRRRESNANDRVKKRGKSRKSVYEKGRKDKTKIKEVEALSSRRQEKRKNMRKRKVGPIDDKHATA